ncbi:hypothetical protein [Streptomyces sp. WAC07149]|nr:hypothetical protein [Streptomyces sp. WAC07149]
MTTNSAEERTELQGCCHPSPGLLARAEAGWARFLRSASEEAGQDDE